MNSEFFFFNDTATTEIYTLSLHDALPIWESSIDATTSSKRLRIKTIPAVSTATSVPPCSEIPTSAWARAGRSEEHTSELQSRQYLVCRLLLEKKKTCRIYISPTLITLLTL